MAQMNVSPIRKSSATGKVFRALYEMIATGRYTRGQKLPPQEELARQFGVSRNPLREAVNRLAAMGLLSAQQGVGTVVEPPTPGGYLSALGGQFLLDPLSVREFIEARICIERNYGRLEWWVLDWNEPAIAFYRSIGAEPMDEWTVHRVTGEPLQRLASSS